MRYWRTIACLALTALIGGPFASAHPVPDNDFLFGSWARTQDACRDPELTFSAKGLKIAFEVDGEPASFSYPNARYEHNGKQIKVELGRLHPYSKTPEKKTLRFDRIDCNTIALIRSKGGHARFSRCPG